MPQGGHHCLPPLVSSRHEMLPHLLTEDTRIITVSERRYATDKCGDFVSIPSII